MVDFANGQTRVLIVDGHNNNGTANFLTFCFEHNIFLFYLAAHMSHLMQPLDVGCFSSLKQFYRKEVEKLCSGDAARVFKRTFLDIYNYART